MVNQAKHVAMNPRDSGAAEQWRGANDQLLDSVRAVGDAIAGVPMNGRHSSASFHERGPSPYNNQVSGQSVSLSTAGMSSLASGGTAVGHSAAKLSFQVRNEVIRSVAATAPTPPVVHNKVLIREEIPAPPRPPPPVEISPPPRPPPPPEYDEEEETRAFWERYPLPQASHHPILSAAHNLHNVSSHFFFPKYREFRN